MKIQKLFVANMLAHKDLLEKKKENIKLEISEETHRTKNLFKIGISSTTWSLGRMEQK